MLFVFANFSQKFFAPLQGEINLVVESNILLFMNHGCNGRFNYAWASDDPLLQFTEMNVGSLLTKDLDSLFKVGAAFNPVYERHLWQMSKSGDVTLRDIKDGEEILTNYLLFSGNIDEMMKAALE